jgi:hypothetical protein
MARSWNFLNAEEIQEHYLNLFNKIFPGQKPVREPSHVIVGYIDDRMIGMIDGYPRDVGQFFIHYAGFLPGISFKDVLKGWEKMMADLKSQGVHTLTTQVKNTNFNTIRLLTKLEYKVYGVHVAYKAIYVDLYKEI